MNTYEVTLHRVVEHETIYSVVASNEEEAQELVESGFGDLDDSIYDTTDQIDFESIEIAE